MPKKKTLLDGVHAQEINWDTKVAKLITEPQRRCLSIGFVYLLAEGHGPFKIGSATNPIGRLRTLQTGNPRPLKIESLIIGSIDKERLLQLWAREFVIGGRVRQRGFNGTTARDTEWFSRDGLDECGHMFETIATMQLATPIDATVADMEQAATDCLNDSDREIVLGDTIRQLAQGSGYVETNLRSIGGRKAA